MSRERQGSTPLLRGRDEPATTTVEGVNDPISASHPPLEPAAFAFHHDIRVRFVETDAMGIVHHSNYLHYLEETRVEYLRSIGHPYSENREAGLDAAVLECRVRYLVPLHFDDVVTVHLRLAESTRATFTIDYLLTVDGRASSTAMTRHAFVTAVGKPRRVPDWLRRMSGPA
jgi:acyl-CoA thioester hydrolase